MYCINHLRSSHCALRTHTFLMDKRSKHPATFHWPNFTYSLVPTRKSIAVNSHQSRQAGCSFSLEFRPLPKITTETFVSYFSFYQLKQSENYYPSAMMNAISGDETGVSSLIQVRCHMCKLSMRSGNRVGLFHRWGPASALVVPSSRYPIS